MIFLAALLLTAVVGTAMLGPHNFARSLPPDTGAVGLRVTTTKFEQHTDLGTPVARPVQINVIAELLQDTGRHVAVHPVSIFSVFGLSCDPCCYGRFERALLVVKG